jgi:hypothetical protein
MRFYINRHGAAIVTAAETVISLGWNVWGYDKAGGRYVVAHVFPPRLFIGRNR